MNRRLCLTTLARVINSLGEPNICRWGHTQCGGLSPLQIHVRGIDNSLLHQSVNCTIFKQAGKSFPIVVLHLSYPCKAMREVAV